jgi:putative membrane protein
MTDNRGAASPAANATRTADHLANERTYLAWIRTSLAVIGMGFAVAKFGAWLRELGVQMGHPSEASRGGWSVMAGLFMIATGGLFAVMAAYRHRLVARQIEEGRVRSAHALVAVVTIVILVLTVGVGFVAFDPPLW